jgi:hypothetical protein
MRMTHPNDDVVVVGRGERGSIAVAMAVILILTGLSVAVLARTIHGIKSTRQGQDFNAALAHADAGVSDALFRIDQMGSAISTIPATEGDLNGETFKYTAAMVDDQTFIITALGEVNGRPHGVQAKAVRQLRYPFAIFGVNGLTFNGNGGGTIRATLPNGSLDPNRQARVGSNHAIVVHSGQGAGDGQVYYTTQGSCSGCPAGVVAQGPYDTPDPVVPSSASPGGCPGTNGTVTGVLAAGTYICSQDVTFSGTVTLSGAVTIYMQNPSTGNQTSDLDMSGATVNSGGDPVNLQIFKIGSGTVDPGNGSHAADFTGIVYAPGADMTVNGGQLTWTGSLTLNTFTVNGNPNLNFNYDQRVLALVLQDWKIQDYTEIPSSEALAAIGG